MKTSKMLLRVIVLLLIMLLSIPEAYCISSNIVNIPPENSPISNVGPVYVGEMYISGDGNPNTAIVRTTAEQSLKINVPRKAADVDFYARYYINCEGWNDHGYVNLWVRGAAVKQTDDGEFKEGILITTLPHCERGDNVEWVLTTTYFYLTFKPPIINADGGAGVCSFPIMNKVIFHSLFLGKILHMLQVRQIIIRGNIVFE